MRAKPRERHTQLLRIKRSPLSATLVYTPPRPPIILGLKALAVCVGFFLVACSDQFATVETKDIDVDLEKRLSAALKAAKSSPRSGATRGQLAMTYDVNGFPDAALTTYAQAEALEPDSFEWPYFQAMLFAKRNEPENAIVAMERALKLDPAYVPAWLLKGAWFVDLERLDDAKNAYAEAGRLGAGSPAIAGTARVLLLQGHPADAIKLLEPLSDAMRHPHLYRMLGGAYRALGRTEDAQIAFARGRRDAPPRSPAAPPPRPPP